MIDVALGSLISSLTIRPVSNTFESRLRVVWTDGQTHEEKERGGRGKMDGGGKGVRDRMKEGGWIGD